MVRNQESHTLAENVYEQLRTAILTSKYETGERLRPALLCEEYGVSMSVVREALTRLAEQKLATITPNRGYNVVRMEANTIRELVEIRVICETAALRLAIERGSIEWQGELLAAHHRLKFESGEFGSGTDAWFLAHRAFHYTLLSGCGNERLLDMCSDLLDSGDLYLRWTGAVLRGRLHSAAFIDRDEAREHQDILDAVLRRDADLAAELYRAHLEFTARAIEIDTLGLKTTDLGNDS